MAMHGAPCGEPLGPRTREPCSTAATRTSGRGRGVGLKLLGVKKGFAGLPALEEITLELAPAAFVAVVGPSGCGKTTLLRMAGGLEQPEAGRVVIGEPARVSFCFQEARLLPWRTALDNVALPLELGGIGRGERRERARAALERVQLGDRVDARPAALSGGMRMRVALARALVTEPSLLLLDEPFGALDEVTRQELDDELLELWQVSGMTALLVTHSIAEAVYLAEEVVVLSRGPGRVVMRREISLPVRGPDARSTRSFQEHVVVLQKALAAGAGRRG